MEYDGSEGIKSTGTSVLERPNYRSTSDEDILGIDKDAPELGDLEQGDQPGKTSAATKQEGEAPQKVKVDEEGRILDEQDGEKKPDGESKEAKKPDAEQKAKEEEKPAEPLTPPQVSEELKAHFADPKVGKELKTAYYTSKAYQEIFPDFQDARAIAELFPSAQEAKHVAESYEGFRELQDAYENSPSTFVEKLHEEGAEEFASIAEAVFERLPELNAKAYRQIGMRAVSDMLAHVLEDADEIVALRTAKGGRGTVENLLAAADVLAMNLFGGKTARELIEAAPDPKEQEISKLKKDLKEERSGRSESNLNAFLGEVLTDADTQIDKLIDAQLDTLLNVEGAKVSKAARQKMGEEIKAEVSAAVRGDKLATGRVVDLIRAKDGDFSEQHLKNSSKPLVQAAQIAVRKAAAKVVPHFTREVLKQHEEKLDKQRQAATRKDLGGGGGPRNEAAAPVLRPEQINYSRTSDEDILSDEPRITLKRGA